MITKSPFIGKWSYISFSYINGQLLNKQGEAKGYITSAVENISLTTYLFKSVLA